MMGRTAQGGAFALSAEQRGLLARLSAPPGERSGLFPCTAGQRALWAVEQRRPGSLAYVMPVLLRLPGGNDLLKIEACLNRLVERHESLRTSFPVINGRPLQKVAATAAVRLVAHEPVGVALEAARAEAEAAARTPFQLAEGPLLRAQMWTLASGERLVLVALHHIVADGTAAEILLTEFGELLRGGALSRPANALQPVDIALTEAARPLNAERVRAAARRLVGFPENGIVGAAVPSGSCRTTRLQLGVDTVARAHAFAHTAGVTDFAVVLGGVLAVLSGRSRWRGATVLTPVDRRRDPRLAATVGYLVNAVAVRDRVGPADTFDDIVRRAGHAVRGVIEDADLPFDEIVRAMVDLGETRTDALHAVMVSAAPDLDHVRLVEGSSLTTPEATHAKFPLLVHWRADGLITVEHDPAVVSDDTAQKFIADLARVLAVGCRRAGGKVAELLTGVAERSHPAALERDRLTKRAARPEDVRRVAMIWQDVLEDEPGPLAEHDTFFGAGGHSLAAVVLATALSEEFGVTVPVALIFDHPTLAGMASAVRALPAAAEARVIADPASRGEFMQWIPNRAQERMLFLQAAEPASTAYNIGARIRLSGTVDVEALRAAVIDVAMWHEPLSSLVVADVDGPVFRRADREHVAGAVQVDLAGSSAAVEEVARPFDLEHEVPLRCRIAQIDDEQVDVTLVMHHVAVDGPSIPILVHDVFRAYVARAAHVTPHRPAPQVTFAEMTRWQRERESAPDYGEGIDAGLTYWSKRLEGARATAVPGSGPRERPLACRMLRRSIVLGPDVHRALLTATRQVGVTEFSALHTALAAALVANGAGPDLVIGTPTSLRPLAEMPCAPRGAEQVIGHFTNLVVLRSTIGPDTPLREALEISDRCVREGLSHADIPFDIVREHCHWSSGDGELIRILLAHNGVDPVKEVLPGGLGVHIERIPPIAPRFDLVVTSNIHGGPGGTELQIDFDADGERVPGAALDTLIGAFERTLRALAAESEAVVVAGVGRRTALAPARDAARHHHPPATLLELIEDQAERTPDHPAVRFENVEISYAELHVRAELLARRLRIAGARPESFVAVALPRGVDLVVALVAVLKSGAAYLPLDLEWPRQRIDTVLDLARPVALLTDRTTGTAIGDRPEPRILTTCPGAEPHDVRALSRPLAANPAYLIFTSGSTGTPKGVVITHEAIVNRLLWMQETLPLTDADRVLQKTPLTFDVSVWEFFWPLMTGATLVVARPGGHRDPEYLRDLLRREKITTAHFVPSMLREFLASGDPGVRLDRVICSGEELTKNLARAARECLGRTYNLYGPTEAAIDVTWWPTADTDGRAVPIGRPICNTAAYLLDAYGTAAPSTGELHLAGVGLARGYHDRPALTAERFVPDPFGPPGSRMYRTGDRARRRPDGALEFLGRIDSQVKIRGNRLELGEVEHALINCPGVVAAACDVRTVAGEPCLTAYVVWAGDPDLSGVQARLRESLPAYAIPSAYVGVAALPVTGHGKLDRAALPEPTSSAPSRTARPSSATGLPLLEVVQQVWARVLRRPPDEVTPDTDVFTVGAHSILALRAASALGAELGRRVPLQWVLENPTPRGLAQALGTEPTTPGEVPVGITRRTGTPRPSPAQRRMHAEDWRVGERSAYVLPWAARLTGPLDVAALVWAVDDVVRAHESLRTAYRVVDGDLQTVPAARAVVIDRQRCASEAVDARLAAFAADPFDLATGPPLRVLLLEVAPREHVLAATVHHIAADRGSLAVLLRDLSAAYRARRTGGEWTRPPGTVRYSDFADWQVDSLGLVADPASEAARLLNHWRGALAGYPGAPPLPGARPAAPADARAGGLMTFSVPASTTDRLRRVVRENRSTLFMGLQSTVAAALAVLGGTEEVTLGIPVDERRDPALDEVVGLFVNTVVARIDVTGDPGLAELLGRVRDVVGAAYDHAALPYDQVVQAMRTDGAAFGPLFRVAVGFRSVNEAVELELEGLRVHPVPLVPSAAKFDLAWEFVETSDGIDGYVVFDETVLDRTAVESMVGAARRVLQALTTEPRSRLSEVDVLDESGRAVVQTAGRGDRVAEGGEWWPGFAAQVRRTPDAIALRSGDRALTYSQLADRAEEIAAALALRGVTVGCRVLTLLPRGIDNVAAWAAVMRLGAVMVPIDPATPPARVAMLETDVAPHVGISTRTLASRLRNPDDALCVDAAYVAGVPRTGLPAASRPHSNHAAYIIHTSGTTGRPKGVEVTHAGVAALVETARKRCGVSPASRVLQFSAPAFDIVFWELTMALHTGAELVILPTELCRPVPELIDFLRRHHITHAALPPSLLAALPDGCAWPDGLTVLTGAERVDAAAVSRIPAGVRVLNAYGPTEATVNSTLFDIVDRWTDAIPIGRPDPGTSTYVVDAQLRLLPPGIPGVLAIGGSGLATGYSGRPAETAQAFVPDPFAGDGRRMYLTGDLVRWMPPGAGRSADPVLEFLGRADDQVQIRGHRVEPTEVARTLESLGEVGEAVALADEAHSRLVAYCTPAPGRPIPDATHLWNELSQLLPRYLMPAFVVPLERLPRTTNGKIDRAALAELGVPPPADLDVDLTPTEKLVARIVQETLGIAAPRRSADLFEAGISSLDIPRLASRLTAETGIEPALTEIYTRPTLAGIAELLDRADSVPAEPVRRVPRRRRGVAR